MFRMRTHDHYHFVDFLFTKFNLGHLNSFRIEPTESGVQNDTDKTTMIL